MGGGQCSSTGDLPSQNCIENAGVLVPGASSETVHRKVGHHCPIDMIPLCLHHLYYHTTSGLTVEFVMKCLVELNKPLYRSSLDRFGSASKDLSQYRRIKIIPCSYLGSHIPFNYLAELINVGDEVLFDWRHNSATSYD